MCLLHQLADLRGVPHDHLQLQRCITHLQSKRRACCLLVQPGSCGTALLASSTCISTLPALQRSLCSCNAGGGVKACVHELCRSGDTHSPSTATCSSLGLQRVCVGLLSVASRYHMYENGEYITIRDTDTRAQVNGYELRGIIAGYYQKTA
jgi:hypothetical protein